MSSTEFTDFYEILQISSNAHADTIERVFRHLAQRYHPDNQETGDSEQFQMIIEAHETLKDDERRARYDLQRTEALAGQAFLVKEVVGGDPLESDELVQEKILSLLYVKCRQDMKEPGVGMFELLQMVQCPKEHMDFHLWYMKEKGWISTHRKRTLRHQRLWRR